MVSYRIQSREHLGVVRRAFGGRVVHRGHWTTRVTTSDEQAAVNFIEARSRIGLRQWRIVHGKRVVREWL